MSAKEARAYANELIDNALTAITPFGTAGASLAAIARFIVERRY
jgi:geranylgeranyl pyrophosphate synthase